MNAPFLQIPFHPLENHRSDKHGRSGMVYWAHDSLRLLATVADLAGQ